MEKITFRRRLRLIRRRIKKILLFFAKYIIAYTYLSYCRFVWATSKIDDKMGTLREEIEKPPHRVINVLWHQDVFFVAWAFREFHGHTIASVGDAGEVISLMLKKCNFTVFRGGSSKGKSRKKKILAEFVDHLKKFDGPAAVGITVDGSSGPIYRMKTGSLVMAKELSAPLIIVRVWCKRRIFLPTWDRTVIPLPFNEIHLTSEGPYYLPSDADNEESFQKFHHEMEDRLLQLTYRKFVEVDGKPESDLVALFPPDWKPKDK